MMAKKIYEINGLVSNARNQDQVRNLKVEAWEKDANDQRLLDKTTTDSKGLFYLCFDESYFKDKHPDVFFRVLLCKKELLNTAAESITNVKGSLTEVVLNVELPGIRTDRKDRITPEKTLDVAQFIGKSDFKGVFQQTREQIGLPFNLIGDMLGNTVSNFNFEPIHKQKYAGKALVNEETSSVMAELKAQEIEAEALPYNPSLNSEMLRSVHFLPREIRPDQQVNLYEKDGKVAYYTITDKTPLSDTVQPITSHQNKNVLAERDDKIAALQKEIQELRTNQATINQLLQSEKFQAFLDKPATPSTTKKSTRSSSKKTTTTRNKKKT